jgi:signal transduction histidine kinase
MVDVVEGEHDGAGRLFVPFFTTKSGGTGLGLAHTQQVVTEHDGKIQCKTAPGKGSTFTVQLPLVAGTKPTKPPVPFNSDQASL